jgi:hypothetical protein
MTKKLCTMNAQGEFLAHKMNFLSAQMNLEMKIYLSRLLRLTIKNIS